LTDIEQIYIIFTGAKWQKLDDEGIYSVILENTKFHWATIDRQVLK